MLDIMNTFFHCRYLDTFHKAGLLLARDFTHLDHDALVSLGITATGHRKRILRLVSHIQRTEAQRANQKADVPRDRCHSVTEISSSDRGHEAVLLRQFTGLVNFEVFRNSSAPNLDAMLTNSESTSSRAVVKPVPKPRTVFNRRRTAPIHFCPTPDPAPPPPRRLSQESICFPVLEGLTSGDTPDNKWTTSRRPSQAERMRPSRSLSLSDAGGLLPPVPPRQNRGAPHSLFPGSPPSSSSSSPVRTNQNQTLSSLTSCPDSLDSSRLSGSSPAGSPRGGGGMEMVSNEIYWGTSPGSTAPFGHRSYGSQQSAPPTPPRQTLDRNPERNRYCKSLSGIKTSGTQTRVHIRGVIFVVLGIHCRTLLKFIHLISLKMTHLLHLLAIYVPSYWIYSDTVFILSLCSTTGSNWLSALIQGFDLKYYMNWN